MWGSGKAEGTSQKLMNKYKYIIYLYKILNSKLNKNKSFL